MVEHDFLTGDFIPMVEFAVEIILVSIGMFLGLNKRRGFVLRSILSLVIVFASCFGFAFIVRYLGQYALAKSLAYFLLFGAIFLSSLLPFKESPLTMLFSLGIAYALQNLIYKAFLLIWVGLEATPIFNGIDETLYWAIYRIGFYVFFLAMAVLSYFYFVKRIAERFVGKKLNNALFIITGLILFSTVILCSVEDVYFTKLSTIRIYHHDSFEVALLREVGNLFSIISCFLTLYLATKSIITDELKEEVGYLRHTIEQGKLQYEISKDTIEMINVKVHDIKYKIGALKGSSNLSEEALKDLSESVRIYDSRMDTHNQLLNVLLMEKSLYCESRGITFKAMVDGKELDFIEKGDLYCLFGNLIDNALEAVRKIKDVNKRVINLTGVKKGGMFLIQEDNYFEGELNFENGLPLTTKDNKDYHGFGTRSLRMIARKYGGELSCFVDNDIFHLNIIIPLEEVAG